MRVACPKRRGGIGVVRTWSRASHQDGQDSVTNSGVSSSNKQVDVGADTLRSRRTWVILGLGLHLGCSELHIVEWAEGAEECVGGTGSGWAGDDGQLLVGISGSSSNPISKL